MRQVNSNEFKTYHPIVNILFFAAVILFSVFVMHPICLCISFISGFVYSLMIKGSKAFRFNLFILIPMMLLSIIINPAFSHAGETMLAYLPSGNPLTLESIIYGVAAAFMIGSVLLWFSCFNEIITSDKLIYLFGKVIPSLSLVFSMALRFVPRFTEQIKIISKSQKCVGCNVSDGSFIQRVKHGITIISALITWSLENAIETADSMKSRGYGLPDRSTFSIYKFNKRDIKAIICILICFVYIIIACLSGRLFSDYFPNMKFTEINIYSASVFIIYAVLCFMPIIIELTEAKKWKALRSKI